MLPLAELLPLRSAIVTLQFREEAFPSFFHQPALGAFLRFLAGSPEGFERCIRFDAPESGRIVYHRGDYYRFNLIGLAGGEAILRTLLGNLARLPGSSPRTDRAMPFRDNCELAALHDAFTAKPIGHFEELCAYDFETLEQEAELWRGHGSLTWQFLAPARLLKVKAQRGESKGEARYCRNLPDVDGGLLSSRLYDSLSELLRARGATPQPRPPALPITVSSGHLFWLDAGYTDAEGNSQVMGGVSGRLELAFPETPPLEWLQQALLGQYAGIGQRAAFGLGRYRLEAPDGAFSLRRALPAASLLARAREEANLSEAWRHIRANRLEHRPEPFVEEELAGEWIGMDMETRGSEVSLGNPHPNPLPEGEGAYADEMPLERLQKALDQALDGNYRPPPLFGLILPQPGGGVRALAVPPFFDRVLQRAVAQVIAPALEQAQYRHSYGFRAGRSRFNARDAVQTAIREGYQWVYESDVDDFFDSVDPHRLEVRLRSLYGEDPVVELLLAWMSRPVEFEGQTIPRLAGLPQGSPLSPAMANLMLDDFDGDMETLGFKLVRFADDFVVLCKSPEQAEQAHHAAAASLAEHGLSLNPAKTRIAAASEGFRYLGYLFVNDLAVDVSGHGGETQGKPEIPPNSWLAKLGGRPPMPIEALSDENAKKASVGEKIDWREKSGYASPVSARSRLDTRGKKTEFGTPSASPENPTAPKPGVGEMSDFGQLVCVTGEHATLSTHAGRLRVERDGQTLYDLPWNNLQAVILFGAHTLTTPAMQAALKENVPVHFAGTTGGYRGVLWTGRPAEPGCGLWLKQANLFADPSLALALAKEIVAARIRHLRETLRLRGAAEAADRLKIRLEKVDEAGGLDALNGLEGESTREFFQEASLLIPAEWGFTGRNRQPPRDPFNSLLSFGYTLLHGYVETLLHADGLLPWLGFYHQAHGRHATLASDLMEPFRHLVERTALSAILRHELSPKDFFTADNGACLMLKQARHDYLSCLLERFNTPLAAQGETQAWSPVQHIHRQNLSLIGWLNQGKPFQAWRTR